MLSRASAVAAGLGAPDADRLFAQLCGKRGLMDLFDFADALAAVGGRLHPTSDDLAPAERIERTLARIEAAAAKRSVPPVSTRAATATRAQAVAKAATAAAARRH